jgi:hypothetical protein
MPKIERQKYMTEKLGKCTHAIEVPGCHYDIGLIQQGDKYVPIWDWFAGGMRQAMGHGQAENPFAQAYGVEMAKLQAQGMGLYSTEQLNNDGSITLRVQLPS